MTRAKEIARQRNRVDRLAGFVVPPWVMDLVLSYAAEERERCAKISETIPAHLLPANATWDETALTIAARIREGNSNV